MRRTVQKILCEFDVFAAVPNLRSNFLPYSSTTKLGIFSLIIYGLFIVLFIRGVIGIINLDSKSINVSDSLQKNFNAKNIDNIMFGIQIDVLADVIQDIGQLQDYFMMIASYYNTTTGKSTQLFLQPCKPEQWNLTGSNYQKIFEQNELYNSYCPPLMIPVDNLLPQVTYLFIGLYPCIGEDNCKSLQQIQKYRLRVIEKYKHFPIWIDLLVSVPQVSDPVPIKYVVDTKRFATTLEDSHLVFMSMDMFNITTDKSMWPVIKMPQLVTGYYASEYFQSTFKYDPDLGIFMMNAYMTNNYYTYDRKINKVDQVISYVGGLLGLVLVALGFFLGSYNEYRYELKVAEKSFNYDSDGGKFREKDLTAWMYIKYSIFDWIALFACQAPEWKGCKEMDETREEAILMIDVETFFKRLEFLEKAIVSETNPNVLLCLSLIEPDSIQEAKKKRLILQYYQEIINLQEAASVEDALQENVHAFGYLERILVDYAKHSSTAMTEEKKKRQHHDFDVPSPSPQPMKNPEEGEETEQQIQLSLMRDLDLEEREKVCNFIAHYPLISKQAAQVELKKQYVEIERELTQCFLNLTIEKKMEMMRKMPIKILHRLRFRAKEVNKKAAEKHLEIKVKDAGLQDIFKGLGLA